MPGQGGQPRGHGACARLLGRYVREPGALSLEAAVHRASAVAANEILAYDRGRLAPGLAADIVVFDPATVRDRGTFAEPTLASEGFRAVLVNGVVVLENGRHTGATPGRALRGPAYRPGSAAPGGDAATAVRPATVSQEAQPLDLAAAPAGVKAGVSRAEQAIKDLQSTLVGQPSSELARGGPAAAVRVYSDEARQLTAAVGARHSLAIGRTSHRLRNPANASRPARAAELPTPRA